MLFAILRIPSRVGFHLVAPACDTGLTLANASRSMTKVPHIVLFSIFFVLTALQFDKLNQRALGWSLVATAVLGLLVEFEEGATHTGSCRLTDVLPDIAGAMIGAAILLGITMMRNRVRRARA